MTLLAELTVKQVGYLGLPKFGAEWRDRSEGIIWQDTTDVKWAGGASTDDSGVGLGVLYLSLMGFLGDHYWDEYIAAFTPPQYSLAKSYGGWAKATFGTLELSPAALDDTDLWPPPISFMVAFYYTGSTEGARERLFTGTAHIESFNQDKIIYTLYGEEFTTDLLLEGTDYDSNTVLLPRAFGTIEYQVPIRLADVGGAPTYHKAYIPGINTAKPITGFTNLGGGEIKAHCTGHGFSTSDNITIEGAFGSTADAESFDYNGTYVITRLDDNQFKFTKTWIDPGVAIEIIGQAYDADNKANYILVYDDGVPIPENVTDNGNGTFSLSAMPVGEVTISGIGEDTTLAGITEWACGADRLNRTYDGTNARSPSPSINYWATSQQVLIEFLSDLASTHTHLFYIDTDTLVLHLIDMEADNGSRTLGEFDDYEVSIDYEPPLSEIICEWKKRFPVNETIGRYVKEKDYKSQIAGYTYGESWNLTPYHDVDSEVYTAISNIFTNIHKPRIRVAMPLVGDLPVPGESITLTNVTTVRDLTITFRCRHLTYDFESNEIKVEGEGSISA